MRRHPWLIVSLLALVGVLILSAFPGRAYLAQVDHRNQLRDRLGELAAANSALTEQARLLERDETVERLARERYHLVRPGEEAYAILPTSERAPAERGKTPPPAEKHTSWWSRTWARVTSIL